MQKGVFLAARGGPPAWAALFDYRPYDWGPYSGSLTSTLSRLRDDQLLTVEPFPHREYGSYVTTLAGEKVAAAVCDEMNAEQLRFLRDVRVFVTTRSFNRLLRDVYAAYPEMATASRFRG